MAYTKRQVVTALSAVLLIALTGLASYALHSIRYYSLPIPTIVGALTIALPGIVGLTTEFTTQFQRQSSQVTTRKSSKRVFNQVGVAAYVLVILETVVATLAGTYLAPSSNAACGLDNEWRRLFRAKSHTIERVQDALNCCGLHSTADMAFPFPAKGISANMCVIRYDRHASCFSMLETQQKKTAGIILAVAVVVAIWEVLVITDPLSKDNASWLHEILPIRSNQRGDSTRARIGYHQQDSYHDDPERRSRAVDDLVGAIPTHSTPRSRDAPVNPVPSSRMHPSGLGHASEDGWAQSG